MSQHHALPHVKTTISARVQSRAVEHQSLHPDCPDQIAHRSNPDFPPPKDSYTRTRRSCQGTLSSSATRAMRTPDPSLRVDTMSPNKKYIILSDDDNSPKEITMGFANVPQKPSTLKTRSDGGVDSALTSPRQKKRSLTIEDEILSATLHQVLFTPPECGQPHHSENP